MKHGAVKDQIVETASRLFYEQGYNATGINQIIEEAGVAKASLYQHFPSKEDLLAEYLSMEAARTMDSLNKEVARHGTVRDKIMAIFDNLGRTKSVIEPNPGTGTVDVTLVFEGEKQPTKPRVP